MCVCVCREGGGAAFCPVLCRRSVIAVCPSMTLRACWTEFSPSLSSLSFVLEVVAQTDTLQ